MTERIIKARLVTFWEENDSSVMPGQKVLTERIAHLGQKVDIPRDVDVKRLEDLGALYTEDEEKAIEAGTYDGFDAATLARARGGDFTGPAVVQPADGEHGGDVASMSAPDIAAIINPSKFGNDGAKLTIPETLSLVPENADSETVQKFIDAENIATDNEPRTGVVEALEKRLSES